MHFLDCELDMSPFLQNALTGDEELKVLVAGGYYDLVVPYFENDLFFRALKIDPQLKKKNVKIRNYHAGHMMYLEKSAAHELSQDIMLFVSKSEI